MQNTANNLKLYAAQETKSQVVINNTFHTLTSYKNINT